MMMIPASPCSGTIVDDRVATRLTKFDECNELVDPDMTLVEAME